MKRYEYIINGGKEELAVAIGFCIATFYESFTKEKISCEELKKYVALAAKDIEPWLEEEVEE
jgi:hypothetical protein